MTLDFPHTCPTIDRERDSFLEAIDDFQEDISRDLHLDIDQREDLKFQLDYLREDFKAMIETLRTLNSNMRDEADKQLDELNKELRGELAIMHELVAELEQ